MAAVADAKYPTPSELLQTILDAITFAYVAQGLDEPNVSPGSDHYIRAQAFASRLSIAIANNKLSAAASNPLTATGDDLVALAAVFGLQPRPASPASGPVVIVSSAAVTLPAGFAITINSQVYQTTQTNIGVSNGSTVQVIALAAGSAGNQAQGAKGSWNSASIAQLGPTATVGTGGIVGGIDADGDAQLRARLLQKLSSPPVGGNASSVIQWAENASAAVQGAACYAGCRGAASYDVAVWTAGGSRQIPAATLTLIKAAVLGQMPGQNDLNLTTVTPQFVDVVLFLDLPLPQGAGGAGGGWKDAVPWPPAPTRITGYNAGTGVATCNGTVAPIAGNSIGVWNPAYADPDTGLVVGIMQEYVIGPTPGGSSGAWTFTVQGGFSVSPFGQYISADALSLVTYASTFAAGVALLGPGEKTALPELLPRAQRMPTTDSLNAPPSILSNNLCGLVANRTTFPEVQDCFYAATYTSGTTISQVAPAVPATTADPPGVLVMSSLAFVYSAT